MGVPFELRGPMLGVPLFESDPHSSLNFNRGVANRGVPPTSEPGLFGLMDQGLRSGVAPEKEVSKIPDIGPPLGDSRVDVSGEVGRECPNGGPMLGMTGV